MDRLDRAALRMYPLAERRSKLRVEDIASASGAPAAPLDAHTAEQVERVASRIAAARAAGRPVMVTFGAHLIRNGLGPVLGDWVRRGWVTHLATNGAGSIHDWELAYAGKSTEDVRENTAAGCFGAWEETGRFLSLALALGGAQGLGYGESIGRLIAEERLNLPTDEEMRAWLADTGDPDLLAARADLAGVLRQAGLAAGPLPVPHAWRRFSLQRAAYEAGVPFTVHPGIGYDILHTHPLCAGGVLGRAAMRDFLAYAASVAQLTDGVHLSIGSAIMAPMIFEKALSMANNLRRQQGQGPIAGHLLVVNDLQDGGGWDWRQGEPPRDNPAYYLRFCKTFHRMGGELEYLCGDNVAVVRRIEERVERRE